MAALDEAEALAELRALQFTVDKLTITLTALNEITSPGGRLYESQRRASEAMAIWTTLFRAGLEVQEAMEEDPDGLSDHS